MPRISHSQASLVHTLCTKQNNWNETFSLEGLIHTPQLSNCTKLHCGNHYTLTFWLPMLLHTKLPLAMQSNMDTPPRDSNDPS